MIHPPTSTSEWVHTACWAAGAVDVTTSPPPSPATHRAADGQEMASIWSDGPSGATSPSTVGIPQADACGAADAGCGAGAVTVVAGTVVEAGTVLEAGTVAGAGTAGVSTTAGDRTTATARRTDVGADTTAGAVVDRVRARNETTPISAHIPSVARRETEGIRFVSSDQGGLLRKHSIPAHGSQT